MSKAGRPKGTPQSAETRAKISASKMGHPVSMEARIKIGATMKARGIRPVINPRPRTRPAPGTEARRLFEKIRNECRSAAAHVELRRGV